MKKILMTMMMTVLIAGGVFAQDKPAPDLSLKDLNGKTVTLSKLKGKVVFLNFFATWCPPCREEMPSIEKLFKTVKNKSFVLLAVSVDKIEESRLKEFVKDGGYTFPVLSDKESVSARAYGISSIPATYLIDKKGNIVKKIIGSRDWASQDAIKMINDELKK